MNYNFNRNRQEPSNSRPTPLKLSSTPPLLPTWYILLGLCVSKSLILCCLCWEKWGRSRRKVPGQNFVPRLTLDSGVNSQAAAQVRIVISRRFGLGVPGVRPVRLKERYKQRDNKSREHVWSDLPPFIHCRFKRHNIREAYNITTSNVCIYQY